MYTACMSIFNENDTCHERRVAVVSCCCCAAPRATNWNQSCCESGTCTTWYLLSIKDWLHFHWHRSPLLASVACQWLMAWKLPCRIAYRSSVGNSSNTRSWASHTPSPPCIHIAGKSVWVIFCHECVLWMIYQVNSFLGVECEKYIWSAYAADPNDSAWARTTSVNPTAFIHVDEPVESESHLLVGM